MGARSQQPPAPAHRASRRHVRHCTDAFVIGGVLPAVARSLGVSTSSAGLLVTAFAVAYALGAPILPWPQRTFPGEHSWFRHWPGSTLRGRLTDRFGAFPVVMGGLAALTLAILAVSAATAASAGRPVLPALAAWALGGWTFPSSQQHRLIATAPDEQSVALGLNSSAIYAGAAIGGAAGGLVLPAGTALVPATAAGLAACATICVAAPPPRVPPARQSPPSICRGEAGCASPHRPGPSCHPVRPPQ